MTNSSTKMVSLNINGNLHSVAGWVNEMGMSDFFVQADSTGLYSVILLRLPIDWPVHDDGWPAPAKSRQVLDMIAGSKAVYRMKGLRRLCGYVENASDTVVKIFQDDATREWTIKVGSGLDSPRFDAPSMEAALDAAIAGTPDDLEQS